MGAVRHPGRLIAGLGIALLIVGAAAIALNRRGPTDTSQAGPSSPDSTSRPGADAPSYGADGAPGASSQRDAPETRWRPPLSPKAPWLAASPSPVVVSVTTDATGL